PGNIGNPNLKPENAWSYEGNIQYAKNGFKIKAGYFYRAIDDYIDWVRTSPTLPYSPINIGENLVQGINMSIHQKFKIKNTHALGYAVSYNYLNPSYQKIENVQSKYILESLKHQFIAGITYSYKDFSIQVSNRFIERELNKPYNLLDV